MEFAAQTGSVGRVYRQMRQSQICPPPRTTLIEKALGKTSFEAAESGEGGVRRINGNADLLAGLRTGDGARDGISPV